MPWKVDTAGFNASLDAMILRLDAATRQASSAGAAVIVKAAVLGFNGQHPPGTSRTAGGNRPQSVSEKLKGSIHILEPPMSFGRGIWRTRVAPTMIYGRRIELGFTGQDALGRNFTPHLNDKGVMTKGDPPYPYLRPGVKRAEPALQGIFEYYWNAALAGA
jgi:hypothetical protein